MKNFTKLFYIHTISLISLFMIWYSAAADPVTEVKFGKLNNIIGKVSSNSKVDGKKILKKAFANKSFSFNFEYSLRISDSVKNNNENTENKYLASILVCDNMYKMVLDDREITCDGKTIWTYFPQENEIQVELAGDNFVIWTMLEKYDKFYTVTGAKEIVMADGSKIFVVNLTAISKDNDYKFVTVILNFESLYMQKLIIEDVSGDLHTFAISDFAIEKPSPKSEFTVRLGDYPDATITEIENE